MKFNEQLLKNKINENLQKVKNPLDRDGKTNAIVEALNFFDNKRDWVTKINREDITSLITNSKDQEVLCESILEKVNNTPFTKALKESKKKKETKQKLNESLTKPLKEEKLNEGTSNFYDHNYLPLLVFIMDEELEDAMYNDSECPKESDYEDIDDYDVALDNFRDTYADKYYRNVCILNDFDIDGLKIDLGNFNDETKRFDYEDGEDNWTLEDIELVIKPGYYEGGQIYCKNEKNFDYLSEDVKKAQLERFNTFLDNIQKKYGLTKLKTAYRMSNGETGYTIVEELKHLNESEDDIYIYQLPKDANVNYIRQSINLTSANSIKLVGKVNKKGDQPGDILISGTKEDLEKFVDDYFDLKLIDDYLYEEDEFDTDLITPLKMKYSWEENLKEYYLPKDAKPYKVNGDKEYYIASYTDVDKQMLGDDKANFTIVTKRVDSDFTIGSASGLDFETEDEAKKTIDGWLNENLKEDWVKRYKNFSYYPHEDKADTFIVINEKDKTRKEICATSYEDAKKYIKDVLIKKPIKEADDIQTKATKMLSEKKYYIDMAWKNGKTWKTEPMTLKEIGDQVDANVTEKQFVDMMSDNIKNRKDAKNLTKAEIVKVYDYIDGQWQGKDVLWSINGKTNESLDDTQNLINDAKKFAKENNKDVKVKGLVNSNECVIDTFPEDFNEMVELFNTKFDVYDEDSELEKFKIKVKSTNENLKEEVQDKVKISIVQAGHPVYMMSKDLTNLQFSDEIEDGRVFTRDEAKKLIDKYNHSNRVGFAGIVELDESLNESDYIGNAKIITKLPKINDQYGYKNHYVKKVTKLDTKDGYTTYEVVTQEKGSEDKGDTVDIAKWQVALKENLKENKLNEKNEYYAYMDKDYAELLDSNVDVYDIDKFILSESNNELKAHYTGKYAIIVCANGKGCVVDYEAVGSDFDNIDSEISFGAVENKDNEYVDEQGVRHKTISVIATHEVTTTPKEVMEKAPKETMKYRDFFTKYDYNDRCASNFKSLASYIEENNGLQENLKEAYSIEQLASGETIDDYKDNCKKYNIKITQLDGDNVKLEGRKEDLINYYKEVVGVSEDMVDLQEGCNSKKKNKKLKEGYIGQTLEDFFEDCIGPETIGQVTLWGDGDEPIYDGDYDGAINEFGDNEFIEFDCGMDKVVVNVDTSLDTQVTTYFVDVQDFIDCFNGDEIEVYDVETGETLFSGDKYDLPDDVAEKIFVSFDGPEFISINIEEDSDSDDYDDFDDEEDFDESLNEDVQNINAKIYYEEDGEPIIVFKSIGDRKGNFDAYVHNGQHTVAAPDYVKTLKKADLNDQKVKDLIAEYESNYPVKLHLKEDTVKQDGKWVNKGNTGKTHGEFKTKKEADKQRKAMFAGRKPNAKWGK